MNFLDFLSESPKLFIFQKEVNKTNFGGFLMLIYLIAMALITVYYIIDYKKEKILIFNIRRICIFISKTN